jgi:hypothetical protein
MAIVGAIRWDAWYTTTGPAVSTLRAFSQAQYHYRAPFFSKRISATELAFQSDAGTMAREINEAVRAKINYWAFLLYDRNGSDRDMMAGYDLFQANPDKNRINWAMIRQFNDWGTTGNYATQVAQAVQQVIQVNYQKVLTNRPLVYIYGDEATIAAYFTTNANFKTALDAFRAQAQAAGTGNPYIVVLAGPAATSSSLATALGCDAISNYISNLPSTPTDYVTMTATVESFWNSLRTAGPKMVPIAMTGWQRAPRIDKPVKWQLSTQRPYFGRARVFGEGTAAEIAAHIKAAADYTVTYSADCDSSAVLVYAWNEFDEGGWLCPTLGDLEGSRCTALAGLL